MKQIPKAKEVANNIIDNAFIHKQLVSGKTPVQILTQDRTTQYEDIKGIVGEVPDCVATNCDGEGNIPHQISEDEWEAEQCQYCYEIRFPKRDILKKLDEYYRVVDNPSTGE